MAQASSEASRDDPQLGQSNSSPTLRQNGMALSGTGGSASSTGNLASNGNGNGKKKSPEELKLHIRGKVSGIVKSRAGPSFEERSAQASARMKKEADEQSTKSKQDIADSVARGRARPTSCPFRQDVPESIDDKTKRGKKEVAKRVEEYAERMADLRQRMVDREPLYKLDEVAAAVQELKDRQEARKAELKQEERERWAMIRGLQEKVLDRPLAMEEFNRKKINADDLRKMASPTPQPMGIDAKVAIAVGKKNFQESQWYQQVQEIKQRQNERLPLSAIKYPPYIRPPVPCRPKEVGPLEKLIDAAIASPSYTQSQWAGTVNDLKQKMNDREKLCDIHYPPKHGRGEPEPEIPTPAFMLKIQEAMAVKCEENRVKMVAEERKQRNILKRVVQQGLDKRDRTVLGLPDTRA